MGLTHCYKTTVFLHLYLWQKITENVNALKVVDRIDLTKFKNARTSLTVNAALRPDYVRNKESFMFLRKVSLKFCVKYR